MTAGLGWRPRELAELLEGRLVVDDASQGEVEVETSAVAVIDSCQVTPGSVFVCLAGEHSDGHDHVEDARRRGAAVSLAARPVPGVAVVVPDPAAALPTLARDRLRRVPGNTVVGVTGSVGKTSTKDILGHLLGARGPVVAPAGSFNNELGLPLTVLRADSGTRTLVLEYGARGPGHIRWLTTVAAPDVALVLNVGPAHLGEFGSLETTAQAKGELVEAVAPGGTAVLWVDDPRVAAMAGRTSEQVLRVGTDPVQADLVVSDIDLDGDGRSFFTLRWRSSRQEVLLDLIGAHHVANAAMAAAAALSLGMSLPGVGERLASYRLRSPHRMAATTRPDGLLVIDDAYNANPDSVTAALRALVTVSTGRGGRSWAVLGAMRELGEGSVSLHEAVGRTAVDLGVDHVVAVGPDGGPYATGAGAVGTLVAGPDEALELLAEHAGPDDVVLVKGANALRLWELATALVRAPEPVR